MFTVNLFGNALQRLAPSLAGLALLAAASVAQAGVILQVGNADQGVSVSRGTALGTSFTLDVATNDVSIDIPVLCLGCSGSIWLVRQEIGPGTSFANTLSGVPFSSASTSPEFSLFDLDAGLYFVLLAIDANSSGSAIWSGSSAPTVLSNGANRALDFAASSITAWVPRSNFSVSFGQGLNITVSTPDNSVPVAGTPALLALGLLLLGVQGRRRQGIIRRWLAPSRQ